MWTVHAGCSQQETDESRFPLNHWVRQVEYPPLFWFLLLGMGTKGGRHLRKDLLALLEVSLREAVHGRTLQPHELRPKIVRACSLVAVYARRVIVQHVLHVVESSTVAVEKATHHRVHRTAVRAYEL